VLRAAGINTRIIGDAANIARDVQAAVLSPGTVRNYLSAATIKLGATNRYDAIQCARTHGWI
jgi:two-component system response regulator DesR